MSNLQFRRDYDSELVYTRRDMDRMLQEQARRLTRVNRIIQKGKVTDLALQILEIYPTPEGLLIYVT